MSALEMNPEIRARWVAALRSGAYEQGTSRLRDASDRRCCLGVLCDLAEQDGVVAGMVDLRAVPLRRCAHVCELGIGLRAGFRDRGVGKALMEHAIRAASAQGFRKIRLMVIASNTRAIALYRKTRFVETGRFRDEVRLGRGFADLLVMERTLP